MWDPDSYQRFQRERSRPFSDLVAAVDHPGPRTVADLGCGSGALTTTLLQRWPAATIWAVDSSPEMIDRARSRPAAARLRFILADVEAWRPPAPVDVIISNACLHWIGDHGPLMKRLAGELSPGGVLAFQVPANFSEPSHAIVREVARHPRWRDRLARQPTAAVEEPAWYLRRLTAAGLHTTVWVTTYLHVLEGDDPVLDWLEGTTLRPILAALDGADRSDFLAACAALLAEAYPRTDVGTIFPFRRIFVVARRPEAPGP
jgi:trans-aconitate 2-methyltransferase